MTRRRKKKTRNSHKESIIIHHHHSYTNERLDSLTSSCPFFFLRAPAGVCCVVALATLRLPVIDRYDELSLSYFRAYYGSQGLCAPGCVCVSVVALLRHRRSRKISKRQQAPAVASAAAAYMVD